MSVCEFCQSRFVPRPQVKRPRACSKDTCQVSRQRMNEREWHAQHRALYDKSYFAGQKDRRMRLLERLAARASACMKAGATVLGEPLDWSIVSEEIMDLFLRLGMRRVNKFWTAENSMKIDTLGASA